MTRLLVCPHDPVVLRRAEAGGKGGGKASKAALKANGSKPPEPEAGPLLGRLVLNMPVSAQGQKTWACWAAPAWPDCKGLGGYRYRFR